MIRDRKELIAVRLAMHPGKAAQKLLKIEELLTKIANHFDHPNCEEVHASGDCQCARLYAEEAREALATI